MKVTRCPCYSLKIVILYRTPGTWVCTVTMVCGLNVQVASGLAGIPDPVMWTV